MRRLGGAAAAACVLLLLTGCGSQASPAPTATVTVAPASPSPSPSASASSSSPAPTTTVTVTATPAPVSSASTDPDRPAGQCADSVLGVSITPAPGGGAAGSDYFEILFTNTGGTSCQLRGTPGVSVVGDGNGTQLGPAAARDQQHVTTVTLQPGQTVQSQLQVVDIGTDGGPLTNCTSVSGNGYRVYPPHSYRAYYVPYSSVRACKNGPVFMTAHPVVHR